MHVILGATGKIGLATIAALKQAGAPVRAVVRDGARAVSRLPEGCEIVPADLGDAAAVARALAGAETVQLICPIDPRGAGADGMRLMIGALGEAVEMARPPRVLVVSDYGAELPSGTGITVLFHELEQRMRAACRQLILLRSAEHMENWARVLGVAVTGGVLPSLHHPVSKLFPTVSAADVGTVSAGLLLTPWEQEAQVIHVEGPQRYCALDVAAALSALTGRPVQALALPRADWDTVLQRSGLAATYVPLITELYDAHNAGRIDARTGVDDIRRGTTTLGEVLARLVAAEAARSGA